MLVRYTFIGRYFNIFSKQCIPFQLTEYKIKIQFFILLANVCRVVVVAQLAERSRPISEDPGSNIVIGNF